MAVAYFQNHFTKGFWPILNTGERAVFYCFTFLFISSRGAVRWGLDNFLDRAELKTISTSATGDGEIVLVVGLGMVA